MAAERTPINLNLVVASVALFFGAIVVWVLYSTSGDDSSTEVATNSSTITPVVSTNPPTTSPLLLPSTTTTVTTLAPTTAPVLPSTTTPTTSTVPPSTAAPTTVTSTTVSAGTAASANDGLGIEDHPLEQPDCPGAYLVQLGSVGVTVANADSFADLLDSVEGSRYMRSDRCPSLDTSDPVRYIWYVGPFATASDACLRQQQIGGDAFVAPLSKDANAERAVSCEAPSP